MHTENELIIKIKIFLNDLQTLSSSKDAEIRLHKDPMANYFFSKVYFSEDEIERLLKFPTASGMPVSKLFEVKLSHKIEICSFHDLAPLIQQVFDIQKGFQKEKDFIKALKKFEKNWRKNG